MARRVEGSVVPQDVMVCASVKGTVRAVRVILRAAAPLARQNRRYQCPTEQLNVSSQDDRQRNGKHANCQLLARLD